VTTFLADCGCERSWSAASIIEEQIAAICARVGESQGRQRPGRRALGRWGTELV